MKCLVIGGDGFIGTNLVNALRKQRHETSVFVGNIATKMPEEKWDYIFFLAGIPEPSMWSKYPTDTLRVSGTGVQNAIMSALHSKCPLLYFSSSAVYGKAPVPMSEKSMSWLEVWSPRERYAIGKAYGEALCMAYFEKVELEYRIVRPFNVYGPHSRKDDTRVVPNFVRRGLAKENLQITGDGSQTRCFCYIDDFTDGILTLMKMPAGTVANIGNPEKSTIKSLAEIMSRLTGAPIEYIDRPSGDITDRVPDIGLMKSYGWEPKIGLEEGLRRTVAWAKSQWV